jgi:uncharacterized short protein YbdD (DUF466 family)
MTVHHHTCVRGCAPAAPRVVLAKQSAPTNRSWWREVVAFLRRWSGDDAYERYLAEHQGHGHALLSRRDFYKHYLDRRAGGSRCC